MIGVKPWPNDWTFALNIHWTFLTVFGVWTWQNFQIWQNDWTFSDENSSVMGCAQLLGLFHLTYSCANWTMFRRSGKTTKHLTSTFSNEMNLIFSTENFWLPSKSTGPPSTSWAQLNKIGQGGKTTQHFALDICSVHVQCKCPVVLPGLNVFSVLLYLAHL